MFRESDYEPPRMHPSFARKPVSILQQESHLSRFEDNRDRRTFEEPPMVPATYDTRRDPSHPEADWGGLVSKERTQKRHDPNREHRSQHTGIVQTEDGIVSVEERAEWARLRRPSDPKLRGEGEIIGGISVGEEQYTTNYHRQTQGVGTYPDQLSLAKRAGSKKALPDPAQAKQFKQEFDYGMHAPAPGHYRNSSYNSQQEEFSAAQESQYGYQPRPIAGSFTKNLGASLVKRVDMPPPPDITPGAANARVSNKTLVTQNYKVAPGMIF
jgi:hypothetical protein